MSFFGEVLLNHLNSVKQVEEYTIIWGDEQSECQVNYTIRADAKLWGFVN